MARTIAFFIFDGFQLLDAAGPIAAFEIASRFEGGTAYDLRVAALRAGAVKSSSGVALPAEALSGIEGIDTLIVAGGDGSRQAMADAEILSLIAKLGRTTRRMCSVCSGSFILAAAGLLDGLTATTHWQRAAEFARKFPKVRVEAARIFVQQGRVWTSAGISAGIDLALALIAADLGEERAMDAARQMVVYYRRPGGQSQFSSLLELSSPQHRFSALIERVRLSLKERWTVERLAECAHMSPRHFSRAFAGATGLSPAKAVERLRAEAARAGVEGGMQTIEVIAAETGFGNAERMRRAFVQIFGVPPQGIRRNARSVKLAADATLPLNGAPCPSTDGRLKR